MAFVKILSFISMAGILLCSSISAQQKANSCEFPLLLTLESERPNKRRTTRYRLTVKNVSSKVVTTDMLRGMYIILANNKLETPNDEKSAIPWFMLSTPENWFLRDGITSIEQGKTKSFLINLKNHFWFSVEQIFDVRESDQSKRNYVSVPKTHKYLISIIEFRNPRGDVPDCEYLRSNTIQIDK